MKDVHRPAAGVRDRALAALLERHWGWSMDRWPEWASRLGDRRGHDRLADRSPEAFAADVATTRAFLAEARAIEGGVASEADQATLHLFVDELSGALAEAECRLETWTVGTHDNPVVTTNRLADLHPLDSPEDADALLSRYRAVPRMVEQVIDNLRIGASEGRFSCAGSLVRTVDLVRGVTASPFERWAIYTATRRPGRPPGATEAFDAELARIADTVLRPAFNAYVAFLEGELLPRARPDETPGIGALPDGVEHYARLIRRHTSVDLSPEALHAIGLEELAATDASFRALGARLFGVEDLPALFARMRGDPALYFSTEVEIEAAARRALAEAEAAVPRVFGRLPRERCEVRPIPAYEAPFTTIAYYMPPVPGQSPGYYYVNTHAPATRPRYEAEVLAFHESVPGHHTQIALAQEQGELPAFRRHLGATSFVEGWALYTERLADELGLYGTDLDRLGMLSFDAWRAARLVVDTGIHAFGWSRAKAEDLLRTRTPLAENNLRNEVDRYIGWPGQALAYKVGQRAVIRLRTEAERALGSRFSLAAFHDAVLEGGAVTLPVLDRQVQRWQQAAAG